MRKIESVRWEHEPFIIRTGENMDSDPVKKIVWLNQESATSFRFLRKSPEMRKLEKF
jgi:glucose-6-phosphate 1-dehydrogenase